MLFIDMESSLSMGPSANLCPMAIKVNISLYLLHQGLRLCTELLFFWYNTNLASVLSVSFQLSVALPMSCSECLLQEIKHSNGRFLLICSKGGKGFSCFSRALCFDNKKTDIMYLMNLYIGYKVIFTVKFYQCFLLQMNQIDFQK